MLHKQRNAWCLEIIQSASPGKAMGAVLKSDTYIQMSWSAFWKLWGPWFTEDCLPFPWLRERYKGVHLGSCRWCLLLPSFSAHLQLRIPQTSWLHSPARICTDDYGRWNLPNTTSASSPVKTGLHGSLESTNFRQQSTPYSSPRVNTNSNHKGKSWSAKSNLKQLHKKIRLESRPRLQTTPTQLSVEISCRWRWKGGRNSWISFSAGP